MTATTVVEALNNITIELNQLNTNVNSLTVYLGEFVKNLAYFNNYPKITVGASRSTWTGVTSTINISTGTSLSLVQDNYRVVGRNIDYDTFIVSRNTSSYGTLTVINSIVLSKPTLGGSDSRQIINFFMS